MKIALLALILIALPAHTTFAQTTATPVFLQSATTGIVSFSMNQTAQLNVLNTNPVAGTSAAAAPICTVQLEFRDSQNSLLKEVLINNIAPGASASLTLTRTEAAGLSTPRFSLRGVVRTAPVAAGTPTTVPSILITGCPILATLEVFNADTGDTQFVTQAQPMSVTGFPILQASGISR
jgi:hypothetical protein